MKKCHACGSTNVTEINSDNDYSETSMEYECEFCGHVGQHNKFYTSNRRPSAKGVRYNYDMSKRPFSNIRNMGKTG